MIRAMNQLKYDAAAVGNHDFNYGLDFLKTTIAAAKHPYLSANVFVAGPDPAKAPNLVKPYVILDREFKDDTGATQKIRVGIIGFTPPQIMMWDYANLNGKVFAIDIVDAAKRFVPQMKREGADIVMVKPAGPYLDVIRTLRENTTLPVAAYHVSGEYLMIKSAAAAGWLDERAAVLEMLLGIRRAGADVILTYFAPQVAEWLSDR